MIDVLRKIIPLQVWHIRPINVHILLSGVCMGGRTVLLFSNTRELENHLEGLLKQLAELAWLQAERATL